MPHEPASIRAWLSEHLPDHASSAVTRLGEGLENVAYDVGGEIVVRVRKDPGAPDAVRREVELLGAVAAVSRLPVPEPVAADPDTGTLAYRKLPGRPLIDGPVAEPALVAAALGRFLSALHATPPGALRGILAVEDGPLSVWLDAARGDYDAIGDRIPARAGARVEEFLAQSTPAEPARRVVCHNDLGTEHVLVDPETSTVTGVIDWTDAAIADPVADLARLYCGLPPDAFAAVLAHYDGTWDAAARERAVFYARCTLLEDIAFGVAHDSPRHSETALANLDRVFSR